MIQAINDRMNRGRFKQVLLQRCMRYRLDQHKVAVYGVGLFSGITTALFPLSVIKTRQMASPAAAPGFSGAAQTAAQIFRNDGIRGFYRGFGTAVAGAIPVCIGLTSVLPL
jgi:solute carrier family 25 protein 44